MISEAAPYHVCGFEQARGVAQLGEHRVAGAGLFGTQRIGREDRLRRDLRCDRGAPPRSVSKGIGALMAANLNQQFSPAFGGSERSLPERGRRELFFVEGSRQLGNGEPRGLVGVFNFGAALCGGVLIYQVRNHHRRSFIARQARLANYHQSVIGFRKIGVVAHRSLCCGLRTTIVAEDNRF